MWPYDKCVPIEIRDAECPKCGGLSKAHYEDGEWVMIDNCPDCREVDARQIVNN